MSNERTAEGLKPSGQMPDAKADDKAIDQQQLDIIVKRLCREFELPIYEFKTIDQVIAHLKWRIDKTAQPASMKTRIVPHDAVGYLDSIGGVHIFSTAVEAAKSFKPISDKQASTYMKSLGEAGAKAWELSAAAVLQPTPMQDAAAKTVFKDNLLSNFFQKQLEGVDAIDEPHAFEILKVCLNLAIFLMQKNKAYGDSALKPLRVMSTADPVEQIRVRMDDKLSRLMRGHAAGEDAMHDLVGYWVLLKVAEAEQDKKMEMRREPGGPGNGAPGADGFGMG